MALASAPDLGPLAHLDVLLDRVSELQGQRNAIDAEMVGVVAEIETYDLWAITGARSLEACVAWKTGSSPAHARALATVARRLDDLPRCVDGFRSGMLSLDQVAVVAERLVDATPEADAHFAELAEVATVTQLRKALKLSRPPQPEPADEPERSISHDSHDEFTEWRIRLPHTEAAVFDAALRSHLDALVAEWKRDHGNRADASETAPPFPRLVDAFMRLIEMGWDADVVARPHGQRTTVVLHVDVDAPAGSLHLGPALTDAERRYLSCDAHYQVWFERDGLPIGCGRTTREIPRRLRRALERRDRCCVVPGCGATLGLHVHHLWHWEDGGPTELWNLVLTCPHHHQLHHRGLITIRGPATAVTVTDIGGRVLTGGSVARPPTEAPPAGVFYEGPTGERASWKWYDPVVPRAPDPSDN